MSSTTNISIRKSGDSSTRGDRWPVGIDDAFDAIDSYAGATNTSLSAMQQIEVDSIDGAIALTLAAPTSGTRANGGDDGKHLVIVGTTAAAHVVTTPSNKINGNKLHATFSAVGDAIRLVAYGGVWYAVTNTTTLS